MSFTKRSEKERGEGVKGGVKRLIDGLKVFKNVKSYFKVEKVKVDGEVGFDNIFLTGLIPLSISILKDFFLQRMQM